MNISELADGTRSQIHQGGKELLEIILEASQRWWLRLTFVYSDFGL